MLFICILRWILYKLSAKISFFLLRKHIKNMFSSDLYASKTKFFVMLYENMHIKLTFSSIYMHGF